MHLKDHSVEHGYSVEHEDQSCAEGWPMHLKDRSVEHGSWEQQRAVGRLEDPSSLCSSGRRVIVVNEMSREEFPACDAVPWTGVNSADCVTWHAGETKSVNGHDARTNAWAKKNLNDARRNTGETRRVNAGDDGGTNAAVK